MRMLPAAADRLRAYAQAQGLTLCDVVESWALSLPEASPH
ncbi:hypothetical protein AKJ09_00050 [Labilithrix luteola]|uniref:Uncharacterized protein n=1 Tax=Labilithrix luteola TaxID=1391654 RepID=A0A0K1PJ15_9BACT|nr:hypothetical protein AKJ09_00050 [Labilithrix luteola]